MHIHEERYYSALNTVDQINQRLDALDSVKFASQLRRWMPSLTEMINKATKEEVRAHRVCHRLVCHALSHVVVVVGCDDGVRLCLQVSFFCGSFPK